MISCVIPARMESQRFPGKPLVDIKGQAMIVRVAQRVASLNLFDRVIVATDSPQIFEVVTRAKIECEMTGPCRTGSDRVAEVALKLNLKRVLNVQGDEPLVDLELLKKIHGELLTLQTGWLTACCPLVDGDLENPNAVKVMIDPQGMALDFYRTVPLVKNQRILDQGQAKISKHIGIYGFAEGALKEFANSASSSAEEKLSLEQLRVFPNTPFKVLDAQKPHPSVDRPEDLSTVLKLLEE